MSEFDLEIMNEEANRKAAERTAKTGGPAFPISLPGWGDNGAEGMTLRDWFAGQALMGLMAHPKFSLSGSAAEAYRQADAMIAERSKP